MYIVCSEFVDSSIPCPLYTEDNEDKISYTEDKGVFEKHYWHLSENLRIALWVKF